MNRLLSLCILLALNLGTLYSILFSQPQQEPEGKYVAVGGHRIWYRIVGNGEPLLIIPGGPGSPHDVYYPHFDSFCDSFKVIYFDAYGRGRSDHAIDPHEYSFVHDVDEIESFRQALSLGQINLYGHSYGGMVAQAYALKYPQSLKCLILANTHHSAEMWQKANDNWNYVLQNQYPDLRVRLDSLRDKGALSTDATYQCQVL